MKITKRQLRKLLHEEKRVSQRLSEVFLPNLPYAPMPLKSIAPPDFQRALRGMLDEVSHSDAELHAYGMSVKLIEIMDEIEANFGSKGKNDHRSSEAFGYVARAMERLAAIYEIRE